MASSEKKKNSAFFIATLELAMRNYDLNQPQIAKKTGIPQSSISAYLKGKSEPEYSNIEKIATGLGLTLSQFFALGEAAGPTRETPAAEPTDRLVEGGWPLPEPEDEKTGAASVWRALVQSKDDLIAEKERLIALLKHELEQTKEDNERLKNVLETELHVHVADIAAAWSLPPESGEK